MFRTVVRLIQNFKEQVSGGDDSAQQPLHHALSLATKCLQFEFIGVLLDETLAETTATHFPLTWREVLQDLATADTFFFGLES